MRKLFLLLLLSIAYVANAQETLSNSKSLVGIWQQLIPVKSGGEGAEGTVRFLPTGNYKIYNVDHTFLLFTTDKQGYSGITGYGTYEEKGEGECIEHVTYLFYNSKMSGTESTIRYKMHDRSMATMEYYNTALKTWVPEAWKRVDVLKAKQPSDVL